MSTGGRKHEGDQRASPEAKARARANLRWINSRRHLIPTCGAHCRSTGEPCKNFAMENGRCHRHGGKTPKGDQWHVRQWPNKNAPDAMQKLNGKLADLDRRHRKRTRRAARRTPEEQAEHAAWQKAHKPGSAAGRAERRAAQKAPKLVANDVPRQKTEEAKALDAAIAVIEARIRAAELEDAITQKRGVFG